MKIRQTLYDNISRIINDARSTAYHSNNGIMLRMYWEIGLPLVVDEQEGKRKAQYGKATLKNLSGQLSLEFGKGFDERNLNNMRAYYRAFPIWNAVRTELSWTHYRVISLFQSAENSFAKWDKGGSGTIFL